MKKLLLLASVLMGGLLNAQTYPFAENFDGMPAGAAPTGAWYVMPNGFKVLPNHGNSVPNALSTEMKSTHIADTLVSPLIGNLTATSVMYIDYRIVNAALYPATGTTWGASDKIYVDAYINSFMSWQNHVATIDNTTYVQGNTYTTFSYGPNALLSGQAIKLRVSTVWGAGDYFVDIDNFNVMNQVGVRENNAKNLNLNVYPNPARENFSIEVKNNLSGKPVEISIYNSLGQVVKTLKPENTLDSKFTFNTSEFAKGLYLVEVKSDNDISQTKLVVE